MFASDTFGVGAESCSHTRKLGACRASPRFTLRGLYAVHFHCMIQVVTLLCASPADNHAEKTERVLSFGKACENSGEDGAAQLK